MQSADACLQCAAGSGALGLRRSTAPATWLTQQAGLGLLLPASAWGACQGASACRLLHPLPQMLPVAPGLGTVESALEFVTSLLCKVKARLTGHLLLACVLPSQCTARQGWAPV